MAKHQPVKHQGKLESIEMNLIFLHHQFQVIFWSKTSFFHWGRPRFLKPPSDREFLHLLLNAKTDKGTNENILVEHRDAFQTANNHYT